jgi:hypothetical protein
MNYGDSALNLPTSCPKAAFYSCPEHPHLPGELLRGAYHPAAFRADLVARDDELAFSTATN